MARKPAFTEQEVIEAVQTLDENNKTLNGTNLRLEIGSGSPNKLMETYRKLLATGKIKLKSHTDIEELEIQLEAQLELLAQAEDENRAASEENTLLFAYITSLESMIPFCVDFEEEILDIFSKERNKDENNVLFNGALDFVERRLEAKKTYNLRKKRLDELEEREPYVSCAEEAESLYKEILPIKLEMDFLLKEYAKNASLKNNR